MGKVMFSQACVILFTGRERMHPGCTPKYTPWMHHSKGSPFWIHPQEAIPTSGCTPHGCIHCMQPPPWIHPSPPPPLDAPPPDDRRSTGGQYASYWNAFLFKIIFLPVTLFLATFAVRQFLPTFGSP